MPALITGKRCATCAHAEFINPKNIRCHAHPPGRFPLIAPGPNGPQVAAVVSVFPQLNIDAPESWCDEWKKKIYLEGEA